MNDHEEARTWAKRLGRVGAWTFDIERLSAAAARDYVRELEGLGIAALWIPESLGSKEIFAHAGVLLASSARLLVASGIANIWARDATAMANGNRALSEDLAQDAFVRLMGRFIHLRRPGDFSAYLRKTVVNLVNSHFRRRRVEERYLRGQSSGRAPQIEGPDLGARDQMRLALLSLPERQRTAIVLRFYEDLSDSQTADIMRCRPGTVRSLVSRGMETLRPLVGGPFDA